MTEYFRIEGLNNINFDLGATGPYRLTDRVPPTGLSTPLTRDEVLMQATRLPLGIRGHALNRGMSIVTIYINIQGDTDPLMEAYEHDLNETLVDGGLYIETQGARGTRAVLRLKADGAVTNSYKTIYHGILNEAAGRDTLGARIKEHLHRDLILTLYCEENWRPETAITLGPNEIFCPSFEEDGDANGRADDWTALNVPTLTMESTIVLHGCDSQKVVTRAAVGDGIKSTVITAPAGVTSAVCYAWIARPAAGSDIIVQLYEEGVGVTASALYNTAGWDEATGKDGVTTFYRVEVSSAAGIVPAATYSMRIYNTVDTVTTFYVDKCYWKWNTVAVPDEWCDHRLVFNHYDTDEGHQNYYDADDLKGDVDVPIRFKLTNEGGAAAAYQIKRPNIFRRTRGSICLFPWHLEAENATARANWANAVDAECSDGNKVSQGAAAVGGLIQFLRNTDLDDLRSRIRCYARLKGVAATTQFQVRASLASAAFYESRWVKPKQDNIFSMLYLGTFTIPPNEIPAGQMGNIIVEIRYEKAAADVVECDFVQLMPADESMMGMEVWGSVYVEQDEYIEVDRKGVDNNDIGYAGAFDSTNLYESIVYTRSEYELRPRSENRLYIHWNRGTNDFWEVGNNLAPPVQAAIDIAYLPQYISPLE